jgi:hypothetical protein
MFFLLSIHRHNNELVSVPTRMQELSPVLENNHNHQAIRIVLLLELFNLP